MMEQGAEVIVKVAGFDEKQSERLPAVDLAESELVCFHRFIIQPERIRYWEYHGE